MFGDRFESASLGLQKLRWAQSSIDFRVTNNAASHSPPIAVAPQALMLV
jgi:hypothetical protein